MSLQGTMGRRVVIAPDKFKGSLTAGQAARAMALGVKRANPELTTVECPVADGGDGTLDTAVAAGFERVPVYAAGPTGQVVLTAYARSGKTAVVEMAEVCGSTGTSPPSGRIDFSTSGNRRRRGCPPTAPRAGR